MPQKPPIVEKRTATCRRDWNNIIRGPDNKVSLGKVGSLVGQVIAAKMLLEHSEKVISNWDSLIVLFSVLIMPELVKKVVVMKYGAGK